MSHKLISRSPDLKRLRDEGYHIEICRGFLLLRDVPYVTPQKMVARGVLVSTLKLIGERTAPPDTHVVEFAGEVPSDRHGRPLNNIINASKTHQVADGFTVNHTFSSKPRSRGAYQDYYEKMTTYAKILMSQAKAIEAGVEAATFPAYPVEEEESVFRYADTASSRAGISDAAARLEVKRVAIVGLGGTGSYVLDYVAKTPVREIHIYDGDDFCNHNAFRVPGAVSLDELEERLKKVDYLHRVYSKIHRGIIPHAEYVSEKNLQDFSDMDFVFLCFEAGVAKADLLAALAKADVPFVDAGMGLYLSPSNSIHGVLRVTTSLPGKRDHVAKRVSVTAGDEDLYSKNIQVCELNALNAALAVVRWKKHLSFYGDVEREHACVYALDGNEVINEEAS